LISDCGLRIWDFVLSRVILTLSNLPGVAVYGALEWTSVSVTM